MISQIIKRDRSFVPFKKEKIVMAIFKAANAVGGDDFATSERLADEVVLLAERQFPDGIAEVEGIQDLVEKVLIENGHAKTAKAYILYREKRRSARETNALIGATINMFTEYLNDRDWQINENANTQKSINGLNNYIREAFTKNYWLPRNLSGRGPERPPVRRDTHPRPGLFRPVLRRLGPEADFDARVRRRARQGGVETAEASADVSGSDRELYLHHPGGERRRPGLVFLLRQPTARPFIRYEQS